MSNLSNPVIQNVQSKAYNTVKTAKVASPACLARGLLMSASETTMTTRDLEELEAFTLQEAALMLQVSTRTLQRMIRQGRLPALKVGNQWRIRKNQLRKWFEKNERLVGRSGSLEK